ncbi:hypothetical protein ACLQ25_16155, partial [Micromonospora sp. DT44]|uniref:hypothetical protein n=1 Tax=Micromonospora sp. DT44 TaxID=3393439 RepID=UPI003CE76BED
MVDEAGRNGYIANLPDGVEALLLDYLNRRDSLNVPPPMLGPESSAWGDPNSISEQGRRHPLFHPSQPRTYLDDPERERRWDTVGDFLASWREHPATQSYRIPFRAETHDAAAGVPVSVGIMIRQAGRYPVEGLPNSVRALLDDYLNRRDSLNVPPPMLGPESSAWGDP